MKLRPASERDIDRIMEIIEEGRASLAALGIDQWQGNYPNRSTIRDDISRGDSHVVCLDDGRIAATAVIGLDGEPLYDLITDGSWLTGSTSDNPTYAVVHRVAVSTTCKGLGVGRFLMTAIEQHAAAVGRLSVRIDTHAGNAPMRKLIERSGYTRCGIVRINHNEGTTRERIAYEKLL